MQTAAARGAGLWEEQTAVPEREKKNIMLAITYSLLLPGMGELYAGSYSTGKYFTIAEGALWTSVLAFDRYATWTQDDARSYAARHAGISVAGKDDQFFVNIGNFADVAAYNEEMLRERDPRRVYNDLATYGWTWDAHASQQTYRDLRVRSDNWFNNTRFVVAAIAVNHVISAINAARITISTNNGQETGSLLDLKANVIGGLNAPDGIEFTLTRTF
jgi:hypothetical protein